MAVVGKGSIRPWLRSVRRLGARLDLSTRLRLALLVLAGVLAGVTGEIDTALPWLAALALVGLVDTAVRSRAVRLAVLGGEIIILVAGIAATGVADSPLLPYLLAPLGAAGRRFGNRGAVAATAVATGLIGTVGAGVATLRLEALPEVAQWLALGLASGLLAAWAERLRAFGTADERAGHAEAQRLLSQLSALARRLPGSLDPPTAAEGLLERCAVLAPVDRAVVLTRYDGNHLVPLAVRGVERVPWRDPMSEPGSLRTAWTEQRTVLDIRLPDETGRRQGSSLLAVPLCAADGSLLGLAAFESGSTTAFDDATVAALEERIAVEAPRLETALLFAELRHTATLEERERLAREMHNGVAQDLAYFGFALDELRHRLADEAPEHASRVAEMRGELTTMIQDIRLAITDLRASVGPERGLGTAVSSYVRHAASAAGLTVHLSLRESYFRLPAEQEMALFRVAQAFVAHVRRTAGAANLWVALETDPPGAVLVLEHDGSPADEKDGQWSAAGPLATSLQALGGTLTATTTAEGRFRVDITLTGGTPWRSD